MIRDVTIADRDTIAALHIASWRTAYRGILPDDYIDGALERDLAAEWAQKFATLDDRRVILASEENGVANGFVAIKIEELCEDGADTPTAWALIDNLHVSPAQRGGGIGRALLAAATRRLLARGIDRAYLHVFTANAPAIAFYERVGGRAVRHETQDLHGNRAELIRYEWRDLGVLLRP